jgi:hypothetical protein
MLSLLGQSGHGGEGVEQIKGKWSLDLGLPVVTRKPRRGRREGGAHRKGCFHSGMHADGEEMPVRG